MQSINVDGLAAEHFLHVDDQILIILTKFI